MSVTSLDIKAFKYNRDWHTFPTFVLIENGTYGGVLIEECAIA